MKRIVFLTVLMLMILAVPAALAATVPMTTGQIPAVPAAPDAPQITRSVQSSNQLAVQFDRELPTEHLLTFVALDGSCREYSARYVRDSFLYIATLPEGGQWLRVELAWVFGGENATATYNTGGGLKQMSRFDTQFNEYVYDAAGVFTEYREEASGIWTRFDQSGNALCYSYLGSGMRVWFDFAGNVCWATYEGDGYACMWEPGQGWFIETPTGVIGVSLNLDPRSVSPLVVVAEPTVTPEIIWYPNNTIGLAGLSLQEASPRLPDKWYNVVPIDLTRQGRQTYFLVVSNARFIGECYVDVWGDTVTVTCALIQNSGIEPLSEYGRWFTSLSQITTSSIESTANGFAFGQPVSISQDLGGADTALLFIRSKCTYRQPFRDGSELNRYWRNTPDWKSFRRDLQTLMPYVPN